MRRWFGRVTRALYRQGWRTTLPPAGENLTGWRAVWLADSMWSRQPGGDVEISAGTEGTVAEFVAADPDGARLYRIAFDNGARFETFLPAPWAIELTRPTGLC